MHQIKLKVGVLELSVIAAADNFGAAQIHADDPAVLDGLAVETDAAVIQHRLEQIGDVVDERSDPFGAGIAFVAVRPIDVHLFQQMSDGNV